MYIWFTNNGKVATVISINEDSYTLAEYASADSQKTDAPIRHWTLKGNPNSTDIFNILGNNWENHSIDLPVEKHIPYSITARQIRLWLVQHGFQLNQIDNAIDTISDPLQKQIVKIEWEYAPYIERNHPWLMSLASILGLNSEQVDQAFIEASSI